MSTTASLRLAYFGDDFTGSTDALEVLSLAGWKTLLFLEPPTPQQLAAHSGLDAIGVAGVTRSLPPDEMAAVLRPAFTALGELRPRHVHYKVCSTFDSSPHVGSIGRAIEVGMEIFGNAFTPVVVGAPNLGRYCVFGNLFARMGIGSAGQIHRLDRHPSMSRHPVTPADESDLLRHLARQTAKRSALFDILQVARPEAEARAALKELRQSSPEIIFFDALYPEHLVRIGQLLETEAESGGTLFSVGSSGVETALTAAARERGEQAKTTLWPKLLPAPTLVISGSCSPITGGQIELAEKNGFQVELLAPDAEVGRVTESAARGLREGRQVIVCTSRGPARGASLPASELGRQLGMVGREVLRASGVRRLVIAGGDTSSYAARALGIQAVDMLAPLTPGAPFCRAYAPGSPAQGIEVVFKGGQVGAPEYFLTAAAGRN